MRDAVDVGDFGGHDLNLTGLFRDIAELPMPALAPTRGGGSGGDVVILMKDAPELGQDVTLERAHAVQRPEVADGVVQGEAVEGDGTRAVVDLGVQLSRGVG